MAKDKLTDYDSTASGNLDVGGISVAEGMLPSGVNNAIRELMSHQKEAFGSGTPLYVDQVNNRVGIGTSPDKSLHVLGSEADPLKVQRSTAGNTAIQVTDGTNTTYFGMPNGGGFAIDNDASLAAAPWLKIDTNNNVGIKTTSIVNNSKLNVAQGITASNDGAVNPYFQTYNSEAGTNLKTWRFGGQDDGGFVVQTVNDAYSSAATRLAIDSSGNLLVGKTSASSSTVGFETKPTGFTAATRDNNTVLVLNRKTSDGTIADFRKDGTTVGSIGVDYSSRIYIGTGGTGLFFNDVSNDIQPISTTAGLIDGTIDLGSNSARFEDIYATNGTIQTSDANEKQQIAALTDAEITAAKAISQLFKTFKWNSAVEAKGDAARTHAGVIAQDVQAAMTAAGLNAGDYAFFISSTWWETQTEVPAVEAVDAIDAVYEDVVIPAVEEELDEDGNVIVEAQAERTEQRLVSEAVEAVEAVAAYTRTDTYDTAEEAPDVATERTRLGIRYPELLAFIGAATEQRLSNIETRLAALEAS